ncbi:MAG: 1-phosphofructokinase [Candidatus Pelethousia sp.]|nr:1-phosphofructokinase [Candidatus Pelethousia sp.]
MIFTVTLNPALDKSVTISGFTLDAVNRVSHMRIDAGGKGVNVSKALKSFGCESIAMGFAGGGSGETLLAALAEMGVLCDFVSVPGQTRTNLKVFDPLHHTYTDINEPGSPVPPAALDELFGRISARVQSGDTLLFAGSAPEGVAADLPARWAVALAARGVRVAADMDGALLKAMAKSKPFLIKPNAQEMAELCGLADTRLETLAAAAGRLVDGGIAMVAVSMGAKGAIFADEAGMLFAEAPKVEAVSTVGAGDTLIAGLLLSKERGLGKEEAVRFAMAAAAAKVTRPGSSPPTRAQAEAYVSGVKITRL